jgi:hypothetical protein
MSTRGFIGGVVDGTEKIDANTFEAYVGFQHEKHDKGRFAGRDPKPSYGGDLYYPVALVGSWPLDALPDSDAFIAAIEGDEKDAEAAR